MLEQEQDTLGAIMSDEACDWKYLDLYWKKVVVEIKHLDRNHKQAKYQVASVDKAFPRQQLIKRKGDHDQVTNQ